MIIRNLISESTKQGCKPVPSFKELNRLVVHTSDCIRCLKTENIEYIKADSNYSHIHLRSGERLIVSKTLKNIWQRLDNTFIRTHKSYIVNLRHIKSYNLRDAQITTASDNLVQVSRTQKSFLKDLFV